MNYEDDPRPRDEERDAWLTRGMSDGAKHGEYGEFVAGPGEEVPPGEWTGVENQWKYKFSWRQRLRVLFKGTVTFRFRMSVYSPNAIGIRQSLYVDDRQGEML